MPRAAPSPRGRFLRRALLLTAAAALGLALLSLVVELAWSDGARHRLTLTRGQVRYHGSSPNTVGWSLAQPDFRGLRARVMFAWSPRDLAPHFHRGRFGFSPFGSTTNIVRVFVPLWPALLLALPALLATRRIPAGHCRACRYDLRALPGPAVCPECGRGVSGPSDA